jgi:hypothetical protein
LEVDWKSLHRILSDDTRRSILELVAEKGALSYTEMMTILQITNTGRLNYHLKALSSLLAKDEEGRYRLTDQGRLAASLVHNFPERVPSEKRLSALKVTTSVVLILLGLFIVLSFVLPLLSTYGTVTSSTTARVSLGPEALPQNTTTYLTGWGHSSSTFSMSWRASGPLRIYVVNQTQYDSLLLDHNTGTQNTPALENFTGQPSSKQFIATYDQASGNVSLSLPQGEYRFYAWSQTSGLLDSFSLAETQTNPGGSGASLLSPFLMLYTSIFLAIGVLLLVLAASILTKRVWR